MNGFITGACIAACGGPLRQPRGLCLPERILPTTNR